ncbi:LLM class flavin-dependent oxidoreductase [Chloroflexia bacterium SDU3-3]|nr:LLM class flavin-dependent oxidoreductase [Chloroflexia bacterium SDU3-3]
MRYGIYLPNFGPYGDACALAELACEAEQAGWDGFFLWDHIAGWDLPMADPWVALAAVAMRTSRIRIGTTVTPLPRRRPWKLAREATTLDHLSGGRLTLGVGIGGGADEWENLGEQPSLRERGAMLDEALEVLRGLWSGEPFSFDGRFYHVRDAHFLPRPLQQPGIPVWVGGFWPNKAPFRRAARWDGVFPLFDADDEAGELAQLGQLAAFLARQPQRTPAPDLVCMGVTPGACPAEAAPIVAWRAALGATWWLECIAPFRMGVGFDEPWPLDALRERVRQGPPRLP